MPKSVEYSSRRPLTSDLRLRKLIKKLRATDNLIHRYYVRSPPFAEGYSSEPVRGLGGSTREKITSRCLYPWFYRLLSGPEPFLMKENHPITDRRLSHSDLSDRSGERARARGSPSGAGEGATGCSIISIAGGRSAAKGSVAF